MHLSNSEIRFGRRGVAAPKPQVGGEDMRRAVTALGALSSMNRRDPAARTACLFYALRSRAEGRMTIENLVRLVETRVAAFEWMLASRPTLIDRATATAAFEAEVYEAMATEPLIVVNGRHRFEEARFMARLERATARPGARAVPEYRPPS